MKQIMTFIYRIGAIIIMVALLLVMARWGVDEFKKKTIKDFSNFILNEGVVTRTDSTMSRKVNVLESQNKELLKELAKQNDEYARLYALVEANNKALKRARDGGMVSTIESHTSRSDTLYLLPDTSGVFDRTKEDEWVKLRVRGSVFDLSRPMLVDLKIANKYDVVVGDERKWFQMLSKPKTFAKITTHSPYDEVTEFKVYTQPPKRHKAFKIAGAILLFGGGVWVGSK